MSIHDLVSRMDANASSLEKVLDDILSSNLRENEAERPARLLEAMRHAILGGGKRLRPFLLMETARLFGAADEGALRAAAAVELLHGYSLVHDDLPAMDNDDLRRGKPTVHKAFDEATAILAGDALLTLAFDVLSDEATEPDPRLRIDLVRALSRAVGIGGMVGGQMLDLAAEGRFSSTEAALTEDKIAQLQAMKTGALLAASVEMGAILGEAKPEQRLALTHFGRTLGAAFQIADDLLDLESTAEVLGKAAGKDAGQGKATLPSLWGVEHARQHLSALVRHAEEALHDFGENADVLRATAHFVAERKS
ncbi:geranylgeranyl pyrophosphate synthase [Agaricicola taiwanensis]|uniref:Geranylgeranyl diphosphate synthase n=1 Tax=Agaricicola taiwanensis TaxID=591372 RepID=A0A8J2YLI0_9RHOB|nr:farnesyl diphosphate synthase [Agaricicola taiwanensis]GGE50773.1 geranylgeranyl pyrophosphate synthase [Agaricicola taiwanensis]